MPHGIHIDHELKVAGRFLEAYWKVVILEPNWG